MGSDDDTGEIVRYSLDAGLDASVFIKHPFQSSVLQIKITDAHHMFNLFT